MRWRLYILILIGVQVVAFGQRQLFTLKQFNPIQSAPEYSVLDYKASVNALHHEFNIASGEYLTTNLLNVEYPLIRKSSGRRIIGIGLSFSEKDASQSDLLKGYEAGFSLATPIQLTSNQWLYFGVSTQYVNKRTSLESLSTGSQWITSEFRYDPNAGLGESFEVQNINYWSLATGLSWSLEKDGHKAAHLGISVWDLNKPTESFFKSSTSIPRTYLIHGEVVAFESRRVRLTPSLAYQYANGINAYQVIWSTKLLFENSNPYDLIHSGNIDLVIRYDLNRDASVGIVLNQPGFSAGFAYNFPLDKSSSYLQNAIQVGISLSKTLWKPSPKVITISSVPQSRRFEFEQPRVIKRESEVEEVKEQLEALDRVKSYQFKLSKDFRFAFGESKLMETSHPFLDEVHQLLTENPDFRLSVIGHTDNVGSKQVNYQLSLNRARVVADYLTGKGIPESQVEVLGRGDTEPVTDNDTEEGKARNRRVEFLIHVER